MRRIIQGAAYDTDTGEMISEIGFNDAYPDTGERLYRTRNGAFFLWGQHMTLGGYDVRQDIVALSDEKAQQWLETHKKDDLVEKYFGEMPEGGAAERRMTLRLPNNLASRLEEIAARKQVPLSRYVRQCLERCAAADGNPAPIV